MRITFSLNKDFNRFLLGGDGIDYEASLKLIQEFEGRGHDANLVFPVDVYEENGVVRAGKHYKVVDRKLVVQETDAPIRGDAFFVKFLGEDSFNVRTCINFMRLLYGIEEQVGITLNGAKSTSYEFKPRQRGIGDLPWIPGFNVSSVGDLEGLLGQGLKIVAKPKIGFSGIGIMFLDGRKGLDRISDDRIGDYFFETFVPESVEKRYIFLDGKNIVKRVVERVGDPGEQVCVTREFNNEPDPYEVATANMAMQHVGMAFGCVDFRAGYLLEINGSGINTISAATDGSVLYDLTSDVVDYVEGRVG
jgi:hypothetical protein